MSTHPTPFPDVNRVLARLREGAEAILGPKFLGLYLYGSLASGGFQPQRSDVDFVVVVREELTPAEVEALTAMHRELAASGLKWAAKLEGSYLPLADLRRYDPQGGPYLCVNEGRFYQAGHGWDWVIQRHTLRTHDMAVAGPSIRPWIDPVSPEELRRAIRELLAEWWAPMLQDPAFLARREYQAFAVLSMCRALHTLATGQVVSKEEAGAWALATLDPAWTGLIQRALAWPQEPQPEELDATLAFIRYTLAQSQQTNPPAQST